MATQQVTSRQVVGGGGGGATGTELANAGTQTINLRIIPATTTTTDDSIKLTGLSAALSGSNIAYVPVQDVDGVIEVFEMTADVVIPLTGAHWERGGTGNATDQILKVLGLNDNGLLKWGVAYQGGRKSIPAALGFTAQASVVISYHVLTNAALSTEATAQDHFWFRVNFNDAGDIWTVQSGINDLNLGSADGVFQDFNPVITGISNTPTGSFSWKQEGDHVFVRMNSYDYWNSNATIKRIQAPLRNKPATYGRTLNGVVRNNGVYLVTSGMMEAYTPGDNTRIALYRDGLQTPWTASGTCLWDGDIRYIAY